MPGKYTPPIRTQARSATILPSFVGMNFEVYNGKVYNPITITEDMVGHKLGEFSQYVLPARTAAPERGWLDWNWTDHAHTDMPWQDAKAVRLRQAIRRQRRRSIHEQTVAEETLRGGPAQSYLTMQTPRVGTHVVQFGPQLVGSDDSEWLKAVPGHWAGWTSRQCDTHQRRRDDHCCCCCGSRT